MGAGAADVLCCWESPYWEEDVWGGDSWEVRVAPVLVRPEVLPPPVRARISVSKPIQTKKNRATANTKKARLNPIFSSRLDRK